MVLVVQVGFLYAGLFQACYWSAGAGHTRVAPVLGVRGGVVLLEGVGACPVAVLVLQGQSGRVRVVWWVVFLG